jgi:uncharacterized protein YndB with AHSA1/START domain
MLKENITVTIKSPRDTVFSLLTDLEALASKSQGQVAVERVEGTPRGGVREAFRIHWPALSGKESFQCETTEWDPPRRCVRKLGIKDLPTEIAFTLEACPEGTRLTIDLLMEPQSLLYKVLLPILGKRIAAEKEKALGMLQPGANAARA